MKGDTEGVSHNEFKNDYFDCMADEVVSGLGLNFCMRDYKSESYMFAKAKEEENGLNDIKRKVLQSERVMEAIDELRSKDDMTRKEAEVKAKSILDEIAHTFSLKTIRFMAFMLSKIVKRMFKHVYVNRNGISRLSESVKFAPLVLVPSHNSYFDFLLTSLIFFAHDLPLPAIASGQDFLNMAIVNRLLRGSGAYFLRRSFASDHFYKSIFTEYVQQLVKAGQMPVEFFLEGTRSRSGKALPPKTGMLSMITEMFFLGHVPDIQFCPISISYECIAEEQLYVFELLGIPKPKESLSGLVKARKVLSKDYGTAYFHIGDVVSLREFCSPSINRAEYALFPRHLPKFRDSIHTSKEKKVIHQLARYLVDCQQSDMVIYPRSIVAAAVLQNITSIDDVECLLPRVARLLQVSRRSLHEIGDKPVTEVIKLAVALSSPVLSISEDRKIIILPFQVSFDELRKSPVGDRLHGADKLAASLSGISLSLQRNKLMHALLIPAYVVAAAQFNRNENMLFRELFDNVSFMSEIFRSEFVRHPDIKIPEAIEQAFDVLETMSCIQVVGHDSSRYIQRISTDDILVKFLQGLICPFLESYWLIGQCLMSSSLSYPSSISSLASQLQILAASTYSLGILTSYESISLQTLKNGISSYVTTNCLIKSKTTGTEAMIEQVDKERLWISVTRLGHLVELPDVRLHFDEEQSAKLISKI